MNKYCVSRDDDIYEAWPDITVTNSGKLICIFTECSHHLERTMSRLMITESTDRGRSWSIKKPFADYTKDGTYYNNARINRLKDGSLVVVCDYIIGKETDDATVHMWIGDAEGVWWSEPVETPAKGIVPDKLRELKSGRWLLAAHFRNPDTKKLEQYLWYSDDKGKNWSDRVVVASDDRYNLCEANIVEAENGILIAFLRENSALGFDGFKAISYDGGETWSGIYNIPIPGMHRPTAGYLKDGRIMLTYRFMQGGKGWGYLMQNTFAAFFDESSALETVRNKQSVRIVPIDYDRSINSDTGYTGWVQLDDGEVYLVNYIVDDAPTAQIRGYSFRTEEFVIKT